MNTLVGSGNIALWTYFQSLQSPQNFLFGNNFHKRFGAQAVFDDPMEPSSFPSYRLHEDWGKLLQNTEGSKR